ncbi:hypothetical protein [Campylobacter troglodytis]|uniref:hypothetical protein n=1 Tax=Campylobacter troglodytis TaxID=654363 RepID=UPI00163CA133|nr:hypothetical protein [Campylobacter troglodytis]
MFVFKCRAKIYTKIDFTKLLDLIISAKSINRQNSQQALNSKATQKSPPTKAIKSH